MIHGITERAEENIKVQLAIRSEIPRDYDVEESSDIKRIIIIGKDLENETNGEDPSGKGICIYS